MGRYTSPPPSPLTNYLFIDGGCLTSELKRISERYFQKRPLPLSWQDVRGRHRKAYYYDAIPVQLPNEDDNTYTARIGPKVRDLSKINREENFHVRTGDAIQRKQRGNEQKMVDVQLAVDALLMASRGLFPACTILTGDLDFRPLISALVDMGVDVHLLYPPGHTSEHLLAAADRAEKLTAERLLTWIDGVTFMDKALLPTASLEFQEPWSPPSSTIASWSDPRFGRCCIEEVPNGGFRLLTESYPASNTHRLEVTALDLQILRLWSEDFHQLSVPQVGNS